MDKNIEKVEKYLTNINLPEHESDQHRDTLRNQVLNVNQGSKIMPKNIEQIFEELEGLKEEINIAKQEKAEKTGQLNEQMKALKALGVNSVKEAKKKIEALQKELATIEKSVLQSYQELKENYEW